MCDQEDYARTCPVCGNNESEPGTVGGHYPFKFKSDDCGILEKATCFGGRTTHAQRCTKCGFLAIFAD